MHLIKIGGAVATDDETLDALADAWRRSGGTWIVVHGAGMQLDERLMQVQGPPVKIQGLRVTSPQGAVVVQETLDELGALMAEGLGRRGVPVHHARGDAKIFEAKRKRLPGIELGRVGTPTEAHVRGVKGKEGIVIVSPIGHDAKGPLNINADEAAMALATRLKVERLLMATDVVAVRDGQGNDIDTLDARGARELIASGAAKAGMIPKLENAVDTLEAGVGMVAIGTLKGLLAGGGTTIVPTPVGDRRAWPDLMVPNYGTPPVLLTHGHGTTVWDRDGRTYHDLLAGIAVSVLGHAHHAITSAVCEQVGRLAHTSNLYAHAPGLALAKRLRDRTPGHKTFLCNSGTEANEAALKTVRKHAHDRPESIVIAFEDAFHGRTLGALSLTAAKKHKQGFDPLPGRVLHLPFNDPGALEAAVEAHDVAGIFVECVQGEGGIRPMDKPLATALAKAQQAGAILVVDEIQTGIGRTGTFHAHEQWNLHPDIITLAKGLGGGMPIGATLIRDSLAAEMGPGSHGSTFGGNPVAAAAANAVLETITRERLDRHAAKIGKAWEAALDEQGIQHRGRGLLQGVVVPGQAGPTVAAMRDAGYLVGQAGDDVLRIAPPLTVTQEVLLGAVPALAQATARLTA